MKFLRNNIHLIVLALVSGFILFVNIKINLFKYNNFDFGKFDLGNMSQMLWYTLHGKVLYLTDYFGTNLPRWAMSHVDPILLLFLPIFALYQHPLILVFSQLVLVIFSSLLVYKIAYLELKSKFSALLIGISYLFYPAVGYLTANTGFHGVSVVIPFFFGAFYVFEKMYKESMFTVKGIVLFWVLLVLTMMGKEQLPLYVFMYGIFILLFRNPVWLSFRFSKNWVKEFLFQTTSKIGLTMIVVSFLWFYVAFFVVIPHYAKYRIEGYERFAKSLDISTVSPRDVDLPNYFLGRYDEFGGSYTEVAANIVLDYRKAIKVFFGGDKVDNLKKTFQPLMYLPLLFPQVLLIAAPDFFANYLTTSVGVGTAEITNHRISMIIPVLFISTIYAIGLVSRGVENLVRKKTIVTSFKILISTFLLSANYYTSFTFNNPVNLWLNQAVKRRLALQPAYAKNDMETAKRNDIKVGEVLRLSELENKDRECALRVVDMIPSSASVSGPDYLGAHLSMRETCAIFPALYNEADYVIVDVFSRKITTILDISNRLIREVVENVIKSKDYTLEAGCGNLFIFKKIGSHNKDTLLPLQERYEYPEKYNLEIFQTLTLVDYSIPGEITRGEKNKATFVYVKKGDKALTDYIMFMSFLNKQTGEFYQTANLPSFAILQPGDWVQGRYYIENIDLALPGFLKPGTYEIFIGMTNNIRTRSIYLGNTEIL